MATQLSSRSESVAVRGPRHDDLDDYGLDDLDDPFRSPSPPAETSTSKKRKDDGDLGIDEEVAVAKRARVPRVKLDETRLLSDQGIPKLRKRAKDLKLKGKGHEFSDAARLLAFYQLWLDDLFPKAKFVDALAMVEKVGHKKFLTKYRLDWINEGKQKASGDGDDDDFTLPEDAGARRENATAAANDLSRELAAEGDASGKKTAPGPGRPQTPEMDDLFAGDIYDATPRAAPAAADKPKASTANGGAPDDDEDDLDALMAEAEAADAQGAGSSGKDAGAKGVVATTTSSGVPGPSRDDYADEEAAMAEMDGLW